MTALSPNMFLRVTFNKSADAQTVKSKIESLCRGYGVSYSHIEVTDADKAEALLAGHRFAVKNVTSVSGNVF